MARRFYQTLSKDMRIRGTHVTAMSLVTSLTEFNRREYYVNAHIRGTKEQYTVAGPFPTQHEALTWIKDNFG
jgi:hypothetical protein